MKIDKIDEKEKLTLKLDGELEMTQSKVLEEELIKISDDVKELVLDLEKLEYTSSAGIRIFLLANKIMKSRNGNMRLINVNSNVYEILKMAALIDLLKPEKLNG